MREIELVGGGVAKVDVEDFERLDGHVWSRAERGNKVYAVCYLDASDPARCVWMHRLVTGARRGEVVDHADGDGLNNQRANLRVCSNAENQRNRGKPRTTAAISSKYKGVSWDKANGKWRAKIVVGGKQRHLGYFASEEEAALAYNHAAEDCFGRFAWLNDVSGPTS